MKEIGKIFDKAIDNPFETLVICVAISILLRGC